VTGGAAPRRKGTTFEREVVDLLTAAGISARRVPLSGAIKTSSAFDHDVTAFIRGADRRVECKRRARSFSTIDALLGNNFALVCRDDRSRPLVVMALQDWAELVKESRP
jgi:hypothetical protein